MSHFVFLVVDLGRGNFHPVADTVYPHNGLGEVLCSLVDELQKQKVARFYCSTRLPASSPLLCRCRRLQGVFSPPSSDYDSKLQLHPDDGASPPSRRWGGVERPSLRSWLGAIHSS